MRRTSSSVNARVVIIPKMEVFTDNPCADPDALFTHVVVTRRQLSRPAARSSPFQAAKHDPNVDRPRVVRETNFRGAGYPPQDGAAVFKVYHPVPRV